MTLSFIPRSRLDISRIAEEQIKKHKYKSKYVLLTASLATAYTLRPRVSRICFISVTS